MPANPTHGSKGKAVSTKSASKASVAKPAHPTIIIPGIHHEAQELAGLENAIVEKHSEQLGAYQTAQTYDSYASLSALRINVPEVTNQKASFVYNYFTADERIKFDPENKVLDISKSNHDELFFQIKNDNIPRFVKLSFTPPKKHGLIKSETDKDVILSNIDKILIEGSSTNQFYTGFELLDTGAESELYKRLNGGMFFMEVDTPKNSPADSLDALLDKLNENADIEDTGTLTGQDKKLLKSALRNIQPSGGVAGKLSTAPTDVSPEIANFANDPVQRQSFSLQFDNIILRQLTESATRIPDTVFQDEFFSINEVSKDLEASNLKRHDPNAVGEKYSSFTVIPIKVRPYGKSMHGRRPRPFQEAESEKSKVPMAAFAEYPKIKIVGYVVQKFETNEEGTLINHGMLFSDNPDGLYIIDKKIRYGGSYTYKIRSLYEIEMFSEIRYSGDASLTDSAICNILVASEGKLTSVSCVENIPPPPPQNLRASFNFREKKPHLSWEFPINPQRDIKRFQIFKRKNTNVPFRLIMEYDFDNSAIRSGVPEVATNDRIKRFDSPRITFLDEEFEIGESPIYTIASVDAHGMSSNYGVQMRVSYDERKNKVKKEFISPPGAPKPYPNLLLAVDAFEDSIRVSDYDRMRIYFDPEYYKVYKTHGQLANQQVQNDLNFLRIDPNKDTYKIHMINLDLQKDKILNIKLADKSGSPNTSATPATFSKNSLNFEFGTD